MDAVSVVRRGGSLSAVVYVGEGPYKQCPGECLRGKRYWESDGTVPARCPECRKKMVSRWGSRQVWLSGFATVEEAEAAERAFLDSPEAVRRGLSLPLKAKAAFADYILSRTPTQHLADALDGGGS